jgi:hypothetical protein
MRFLKSKLVAGGATAAALALLALPGAALASSHNPTGEFEQFGECPLNRVTITDCVFSVSGGGEFTVGKKTVPLVNPVTLQGGFEGEGEEVDFYGAENGETLSKTPQPVPGGLLGIVAPSWWPKFLQNWFNEQINNGLTGVTATVELTGPSKGLTNVALSTENLLFEEGTALGLPAKIKLSNPILGSNCYIGSESHPVQLNFTTGESGSLTGAVGNVEFNKAFTLITISGGRLVDGLYAAPGASGCGGIFSFFIDPLVNSILGIPSGSGSNAAVLEGVLKDGNAKAVKASEP